MFTMSRGRSKLSAKGVDPTTLPNSQLLQTKKKSLLSAAQLGKTIKEQERSQVGKATGHWDIGYGNHLFIWVEIKLWALCSHDACVDKIDSIFPDSIHTRLCSSKL